MTTRLLVLLFLLITGYQSHSQNKEYFPDPDTTIHRRLEQWQDLKFGLLIHWGAYSQWSIVESWSICPEDLSWATGGRKPGVADSFNEYLKQYEGLKSTFNPVKFNPEKWAAAAKNAGMKYVVFTTKHHDGFCMFDSKYTDYKVTDPGCAFSSHPKKNITKELFSAFRKENMWIGAYFSKPDWHSDYYWWKKFPPVDRNCNYSIQKYPEQWKKFTDYTHNQINELMTDYGSVDILWLDGGWVRKKTPAEITTELQEEYEGSRWTRNPQSQDIDMKLMVQEVRTRQPGVIVVDRAVPGEQQNYLTPEQHIPDSGLTYPWETCMTMATSWSYVANDTYKSTDLLITNLVDVVSKGGNFLLNVGPGPDGELDPIAYERMSEIGQWVKQNGEAIYGSEMYKVFGEGDNVRYTQSKDGKTVYIFMLEFPETAVMLQKASFPMGTKLSALDGSQTINWKRSSNAIVFNVPLSLKKAGKHVWVLKAQLP